MARAVKPRGAGRKGWRSRSTLRGPRFTGVSGVGSMGARLGARIPPRSDDVHPRDAHGGISDGWSRPRPLSLREARRPPHRPRPRMQRHGLSGRSRGPHRRRRGAHRRGRAPDDHRRARRCTLSARARRRAPCDRRPGLPTRQRRVPRRRRPHPRSGRGGVTPRARRSGCRCAVTAAATPAARRPGAWAATRTPAFARPARAVGPSPPRATSSGASPRGPRAPTAAPSARACPT